MYEGHNTPKSLFYMTIFIF